MSPSPTVPSEPPTHQRLARRRIVLGVTGSVAAYKAAALARLLLKDGAEVTPVLTASARRFVGDATLGGLTGKPVLEDMFDPRVGGEAHVTLAAASDAIVIAPATADLIARLAGGRADDLLTATVLSAECPVLIAPAMHPRMWSHPATQRNVSTLIRDGRVTLAGPVTGEVASGDTGLGRMLEPEEILEAVIQRLGPRDLAGHHVVVTAGPTVEDLDAVRFISNRSSGKMGFAIAERAAARGARVTLIAGPTSLTSSPGIARVDVRSALEMRDALHRVLGADLLGAEALVMAAAVGDYRPESRHPEKLKRGTSGLTLTLVQNPDLLEEIGRLRTTTTPVLIGFAVETGTDEEILRYAEDKLTRKRADVIIANHANDAMGRDDNRITIVEASGATGLPSMHKAFVADRILDWLARRLAG
jgi:phosphopantothenoylcysteine decarboxylase / phosphopantothenate---cysteine ligase